MESKLTIMPSCAILVFNSGSSSLKFGLYEKHNGDESPLITGSVDDIADAAGADSTIQIQHSDGTELARAKRPIASSADALHVLTEELAKLRTPPPCAIGHRVVHGGPALREHQRITPQMLQQLQDAVHYAPLHIPASLALIRKTEQLYPGVAQYACFDTAFHRTLPPVASHFALPKEMTDSGIIRYGFHGLSYESIVHQLGANIPERAIAAHLGSGASLAALRRGVSIDTTMGLTPTGGIVMGTRTGDLDPGVILHLMRTRSLNSEALETILNHKSGLLGVSGGISDMRELEKQLASNDDARSAVEMFAYSIAKAIGAFAAALGGLDLLIFTGGIGEHDSALRDRVCQPLRFLGIDLDPTTNQASARRISKPNSPCTVNVLTSDENRQIAIHTRTLHARA